MNQVTKTIPISDSYFAAYAALHDVTPQLKKINNRVSFIFPATDKFYELVKSFYETQDHFSLTDYIDALKKIKSLMYAVREGNGNHE